MVSKKTHTYNFFSLFSCWNAAVTVGQAVRVFICIVHFFIGHGLTLYLDFKISLIYNLVCQYTEYSLIDKCLRTIFQNALNTHFRILCQKGCSRTLEIYKVFTV